MLSISRVIVFIMPLFLVACVSNPQQAQQKKSSNNAKTSTSQAVVDTANVSETASAPQAVLSLIERSQQQRNSSDIKGAAISLERAIHITPRYPDSYYYLAEVRYIDEQYALARSLAKKSLSLGAQGDLLENILVLLDNINESEVQ